MAAFLVAVDLFGLDFFSSCLIPSIKQEEEIKKAAPAISKKYNPSIKQKEEVKKVFNSQQQAVGERKDSFIQWCLDYLTKAQAPVDVPAFVSFLKVRVYCTSSNSINNSFLFCLLFYSGRRISV